MANYLLPTKSRHDAVRIVVLTLPMFGEHLLSSDQQRPVALVESEKSALISSFYLPQYLWIASGGKNEAFNRDAMSVLRNRRVLLFLNLGATE